LYIHHYENRIYIGKRRATSSLAFFSLGAYM
jgi:hypothetical protein